MKVLSILSLVVAFTLLALPVRGQRLDCQGIAASFGLLFPEEWQVGSEGSARILLGQLSEGLYFAPALSYWRGSRSIETVEKAAGFRNIALSINALYFARQEKRGFYTGGGVSVNVINRDYYYHTLAEYGDEERYEVGFIPCAGYSVRLGGRLAGFVEIRYHIIPAFSTLQMSTGVLLLRH